jgi:hypothetical protein
MTVTVVSLLLDPGGQVRALELAPIGVAVVVTVAAIRSLWSPRR